MTLDNFRVGDRVMLGAWTNSFMRGDPWGTVVKVGRKLLVHFDKRDRVLTVSPSRVDRIAVASRVR